ncbi:MAG: response regulator [Anaerolineae bacterium]|nr:response regulator [Anaerolineae bacterium]
MTIKILVADDVKDFHDLISSVFHHQIEAGEFEFIFALDGQEALDKLQADPDIDVFLVDIFMPKIDGLSLLDMLQEPHFNTSPALTSVVISAYDDLKNIRKAMNAMAFDFLTKPVNIDDIRITITKAVAQSRRIKESIAKYNLAQETLRQANEELEMRIKERTAELDAFAQTAAHDLKAPLGNVIGYVDFLNEYFSDLAPEEMQLVLDKIKASGQKGIKIVDELLLLAGIDKTSVKIVPIDMGTLIGQVLYDLDLSIKQTEAQITIPDTWPTPLGYAPWLEVVWMNYITNALKYGGSPPILTLGYTPTPHKFIRFWIKDNGPGLSKEHQRVIFTEFTRLDESGVQGHGLGLATVRRIIEKLNGDVGVESTLGQGSTFYFTLPTR